MRILNRSSWFAAGLAAGWLVVHAAAADETVGEVAGAILENPDCAGAALANEVVEEGLRRGGRRLLSRLGVEARQRSMPVPCGGDAATAATAPAAATPATGAPAAPATQAASPAASDSAPAAARAEAEPERRGGLFSRLRQQANDNTSTSQGGRNCGALGTACANGLQPLVDCVNEVTFWGEMAVAVERKRDTSSDLTAAQRAEIDEDIAAMRRAHDTHASRVEPADPARPNRHLDWLTPEEYSVAATAASQKINAHREECNRRHAHF